MSLSIERTGMEQAEELWDIQRRVFRDDLDKYNDSGNPARESLSRLKEKIGDYLYLTIYFEDKIIGGVDIRQKADTHYRLNRIYIDPDYQNRGLGFETIKLVESKFPHASIWNLDTPHLSFGNHHLYEKLGYQKVGERKISDELILFDYVKKVR